MIITKNFCEECLCNFKFSDNQIFNYQKISGINYFSVCIQLKDIVSFQINCDELSLKVSIFTLNKEVILYDKNYLLYGQQNSLIQDLKSWQEIEALFSK